MEKILKILLIEDDNDDVELLQDALHENLLPNTMHVIKDGGLVAGYLEVCEEVPDIIVMDLNLPKVHGRELIKHIKQLDIFKTIPLVVLTTSSSQNDIDYSYKEGASTHLIKPTTSVGFAHVVDVIRQLTK